MTSQGIEFFDGKKLKGTVKLFGTAEEKSLVWSSQKDRVGIYRYRLPADGSGESTMWFIVFDSSGKQIFERELEHEVYAVVLPDDPQLVIVAGATQGQDSVSHQIRRYRGEQLEKNVSIVFPHRRPQDKRLTQVNSLVQLKDGRIVVVSRAPARIALLTGELEVRWEKNVKPGRLVKFKVSPDETLLACFSMGDKQNRGSLQVFDASDGKERWNSSRNVVRVDFDFVGDNQILIYGSKEKELNLFDKGGKLRRSKSIDAGTAGIRVMAISEAKIILAGVKRTPVGEEETEIFEVDESLNVKNKKNIRGTFEMRRSRKGVTFEKDGQFFEAEE